MIWDLHPGDMETGEPVVPIIKATVPLSIPGVVWAKVRFQANSHTGKFHAWDANGQPYCRVPGVDVQSRKSRSNIPQRSCRYCKRSLGV
jgi:hypothetical protein